MYTVRKIDRCGTIRQSLDISLRSKAVNTVRKKIQVILEKAHELPVIGHVLLPFKDLTEPVQLLLLALIYRQFAIGRFLIFPVCSDTIFCCLVHFESTDLDLKWLSIWSDQCGMQGLVHIWLRHGNVILESARDRFVHLMDDAKGCITVLDCIYQNTDCKQIINLIDRLVLIDHLLVNTEEMLDSSIHLCLDSGIVHMLLDLAYDIIDKFLAFTLTKSDLVHKIIIYIRFEIFQ